MLKKSECKNYIRPLLERAKFEGQLLKAQFQGNGHGTRKNRYICLIHAGLGNL